MKHFNWTDNAIESFIEDNYSDLLMEWTDTHPIAWEKFQNIIVRPTGRPYTTPDEASLMVWKQYVRWHQTSEYAKAFEDNIINNLPEIDNDPTGGDGEED